MKYGSGIYSVLCGAVLGLLPVMAEAKSCAGCGPVETPAGFKLALDMSTVEIGELPAGLVQTMSLSAESAESRKWQKVFDAMPKVKGLNPNRGRKVLEAFEPAGEGYNLMLADETNLRDVKMIVRIKDMTGAVSQAGGMVWRVQDADNYYMARWDPIQKNAVLERVVDGKLTQLGTIEDIQNKPSRWHGFRVKHLGDAIEVEINGKKLNVTDDMIAAPGKVGMVTKGDAVTRFRDMEVETFRKGGVKSEGAPALYSIPGGYDLILSIEDVKEGDLPDGFVAVASKKNRSCKWETVVNTYAASYRGPGKPPKKRNVLRLSEPAGKGYNLLLAERTNFKDLKFSVTLDSLSGEIDQGGGPIWRAKDEDNYYIARWNPLEENVRLYHVTNGKRTQIGTAEGIPVERKGKSKWRELSIEHVGDKISVQFDGKTVIEVADSTHAESGMVGLWTKADASTQFRNLTIETPGL